MKVLLVSNLYPSNEHPFHGSFVKNVEDQLSNEGLIFKKAVIQGKSHSKLNKIVRYILFFKDVMNLLSNSDYDIVYVHYISHSLIPFLFLRRYLNKPLILNAHGSDVIVNNKLSRLIQALVYPIVKKSDLMIVPSSYFRKVVHEMFSIEESKIFISPSGGVDMNMFFPLKTKRKPNVFTIGFVSRIEKGKGWIELLESLSLLKDENIRVLLVGSGVEEEEMLDMISQLDLHSIVEVHGSQPQHRLPYYFNKMDIFVFSTRLSESLGLVGLEAMACGIPVVGSNIGALPSYITDGVNGKLFEPGDIGGLARCIQYFAQMQRKEFQVYKENALETAIGYESKTVAKALANRLLETRP